MNKLLKCLPKILILWIFIMCLGCTKDIYEDATKPNESKFFKTINFEEFEKNHTVFQKYKGFDEVKTRALASRSEIDSLYGFTVKTDEAKYIKEGDYDSYTFEIYWPNAGDEKLSNLLLSKNADGGYDAYIVIYDFSKESLSGMTQVELASKETKFFYLDYESGEARVLMEGCVFWYEQHCNPPRDGNNDGGSIEPECIWVRKEICAHPGGGGPPDGWDAAPGTGNPSQNPTTGNPPSGSGSGSGSPTHITSPTVCARCPNFNDGDTPCNQLKFALERDATNSGLKPNLKPQIQWLQGKVDENLEYGVEIKKSVNIAGDMAYTPTQKASTANFEIALEQNSYMIGWLHSHPLNAYGMFSFGDLKFLRDGYETSYGSRKQEVFTIIVCRDKLHPTQTNTYALKVDDFAVFSAKVDAVWNLYANISNDDEKRKKIHLNQSKIYDRSNNQLEKSFLQQFQGFGISLYKANNNLTNWSKLDLSTTPNSPLTVIETPCN